MKKLMTALLAVAFLGGSALAVDKETQEAAKAANQKQAVEETHQARPAKKKAKKKAKAGESKSESTGQPAKPETK